MTQKHFRFKLETWNIEENVLHSIGYMKNAGPRVRKYPINTINLIEYFFSYSFYSKRSFKVIPFLDPIFLMSITIKTIRKESCFLIV